ncbi:RNase H domain-containing protein [Trichonephila clavipes]|nr:RNase H domain-containing protein [Trichonephila clavipes]
MGSNLYTGGIFVDGSLKNTPLHRLFYSTVPTSTQAERSFRKMAARLLHGRLLFTFQTLIKMEILFQSRPLHRRSIHAEFKPLHRLNEVSKKWRSVSFTDAFVHGPDFGSKSKFYQSRSNPHNLWETTRGSRRLSFFYFILKLKQKLIKNVAILTDKFDDDMQKNAWKIEAQSSRGFGLITELNYLKAVVRLQTILQMKMSQLPICWNFRNENADKVAKEARNLNNDNCVNITLLNANAVENFKLRDKSIPVKHQICNVSGDRIITKTIARLRTDHYRGIKFDWDGRRSNKSCDNCLDTELTPVHIFDCTAILAALEAIGDLFSPKNLHVVNIEQTTRAVIWAHGTI